MHLINVYTRAPCSGYDTASSGPSPFCTCVKGKNIASVLWTNQKLSGGVVCQIIFFRGTWKVLICNGIFILKDILDEDKKKVGLYTFSMTNKNITSLTKFLVTSLTKFVLRDPGWWLFFIVEANTIVKHRPRNTMFTNKPLILGQTCV